MRTYSYKDKEIRLHGLARHVTSLVEMQTGLHSTRNWSEKVLEADSGRQNHFVDLLESPHWLE